MEQPTHQEWRSELVQVADTLSEVVRVAQTRSARTGVTVSLELRDRLPATVADPDRLKQLWTNLLGNAIKFSPDGAAVYVTASLVDDAIVVEVRDQGLGIKPEDHDRIFERFSQVTDDGLIDKPIGTGLGLAIVREIAEHHGARVEVESEWGVGSTFRVVLPVRVDTGASVTAAPSPT